MFFPALGSLGAAVTLPGTVELATLTIGSLLPERTEPSFPEKCGRIAVVVPAHNEEGGIARCVQSILDCTMPPGGRRILVIADNCSDETALRAREAGAEVLERNDLGRRGKGYALEMAFDYILKDEAIEAVCVVDADTSVQENFLVEMAGAFGAGADGAQCRYLVDNPDGGDKTRLMNVALMAFNIARPRARQRFGLSVGILGNGFALHRRVLSALPYTARSVVEDLEYHLMLVREGFQVRFVSNTSVSAALPTSDAGQVSQRSRWEGGRYRMIREHVPGLLAEVARGDRRLVEPLGELLLLPLATHVGLLGGLLLVPFPPTQLYAAGALGLVGVHVAASIKAGGGGAKDWKAIAKAPAYVLQKAKILPKLLKASSRTQEWVRTQRD